MHAARVITWVLGVAAAAASAVEVEVDGSGRASAPKSTKAEGIRMEVVNDLEVDANCFWRDAGGGLKLLFNVERDSETGVNTFLGHRFQFREVFGGGGDGSLIGDYTVTSAAPLLLSSLKEEQEPTPQAPAPVDAQGAAEEEPEEDLAIPSWASLKAAAETDDSVDKKTVAEAEKVLAAATPSLPRTLKVAAQGIKFRSMLDYDVRIFWSSGKGLGTFQGHLRKGVDSGTNSYVGHTFLFRKMKSDDIVAQVTVKRGQVIYLVQDGGEVKDKKKLRDTQMQLAFMKEYEAKAKRPWVAAFPKPPLTTFMLEPGEVGENKTLVTPHGKFHCIPGNKALPYDPAIHTDCAPEEELELTVTTLSIEPRAFQVENFLSVAEAEHIKDIAGPRLKRSSVGNSKADGGYVSSTRTSSNAWVARKDSSVIDRLHRRAADVLGLRQEHLWPNGSTGIAEQLQVVHYENNQEYTPHHDWDGTSRGTRLVTMLLYLTDQEHPKAGGETAFPKAATPSGRTGIKVPPKQGRAVIFYSQLKDGNCDDYSVHAALPVREGEKWLANFWLHNAPRSLSKEDEEDDEEEEEE